MTCNFPDSCSAHCTVHTCVGRLMNELAARSIPATTIIVPSAHSDVIAQRSTGHSVRRHATPVLLLVLLLLLLVMLVQLDLFRYGIDGTTWQCPKWPATAAATTADYSRRSRRVRCRWRIASICRRFHVACDRRSRPEYGTRSVSEHCEKIDRKGLYHYRIISAAWTQRVDNFYG